MRTLTITLSLTVATILATVAHTARQPELLSANALYREFHNNDVDASVKYVDKAVVLEGRRGDVILHQQNDAAVVHIADGSRSNALILSFPDPTHLQGIARGSVFRFRCTVDGYRYAILWLVGCSIAAGSGTAAPGRDGERPTVVGGLLSANALYRAFEADEGAASARYVGQVMVLEGLRGQVIATAGGSAAVHIEDRMKSNALILSFPDRRELAGIDAGQRFRFRCTVESFKYLSVWMENCTIVR